MAVPHGIDRSGAAGGTGNPGMIGSLNDLADPNADRIVFWDESVNDLAWLELSNALLITGTVLSLDTAGSPQVAGLNVGHATDTTVSRASAGDIQVEGNRIFRVGGVDVPVADGGTGSSTAAAAFTAIVAPGGTLTGDVTTTDAYTLTTGTATAYIVAPGAAITAYAAGVRLGIRFHAASGAAPTLQISGIALPPNLVKQLSDGTFANIAANDIPIDHVSDVTLLSVTQALVHDLPVRAPTVQVFTANGTYTKPAGLTSAIVEVAGGGGGSGGCDGTAGVQAAAAAGGAGGGYARERLAVSAIGATETVTIGAGGTAGAAGNFAGAAGGTSSFGPLLSATGGGGGVGSGATGGTIATIGGAAQGGLGSGGDLNVRGGPSGCGLLAGPAAQGTGGFGGNSVLGGGGDPISTTTSTSGRAGGNYGGGASGSAVGASQAAVAGSAGAPGIVLVTEFYS